MKTWGERTYPNITPWFPGDVSPVRPGVYMIDQSRSNDTYAEEVFSYWDGKFWYQQDSEPKYAMLWVCYGPKKAPVYRWRGLLKE